MSLFKNSLECLIENTLFALWERQYDEFQRKFQGVPNALEVQSKLIKANQQLRKWTIIYGGLQTVVLFSGTITHNQVIMRMSIPMGATYLCFSVGMIVVQLGDAEQSFLTGVLVKRLAQRAHLAHPRAAEKLLDLLLPPENAEDAIDHINAQFEKRRTRYGLAHARRWYWWQVLRSISEGTKYLIETALKVSGK